MNAPTPRYRDSKLPTLEIALKEQQESGLVLDPNKMMRIEMTIPQTDVPKLHAFMQSDNYEKAEALRKVDIAEYTKSLEYVVNYASREYGSGATVFAQFLASLYNGNRVKADVSGVASLDGRNFEHLMNVIRLCFDTRQEPHSFFQNGNDIFEAIIKRHGLEKRRRKS